MLFSNMSMICILLPPYCEYFPPCVFSFFLSAKKLLLPVQRDLFPFAKAQEMYCEVFFFSWGPKTPLPVSIMEVFVTAGSGGL